MKLTKIKTISTLSSGHNVFDEFKSMILVLNTLYLQFKDQFMNESKFFRMTLSFCHFPTQPDVRPILVISIHESQGTN